MKQNIKKYSKIMFHFVVTCFVSIWMVCLGFERVKPFIPELSNPEIYGVSLFIAVYIMGYYAAYYKYAKGGDTK
jgi:hypothetical protein